MNIKELEDSLAMQQVIPERKQGRIKESVLKFIEAAGVGEEFHRLHVAAFIIENSARSYKEFEVDALVKTVRHHFHCLEKEGVIERTGETAKHFKVFLFRRKEQ